MATIENPAEVTEHSFSSVFSATPEEITTAFTDAVKNRDNLPSMSYVTLMDKEGKAYKEYQDGRLEYVFL